MRNRTFIISLVISFTYVFIGTITVMAAIPKYEMFAFYNNPLWLPLAIITLPIDVLLFGLIMVDNSLLSILILQSVVFLMTWFLFYRILNWIKKKKNRNTEK